MLSLIGSSAWSVISRCSGYLFLYQLMIFLLTYLLVVLLYWTIEGLFWCFGMMLCWQYLSLLLFSDVDNAKSFVFVKATYPCSSVSLWQ